MREPAAPADAAPGAAGGCDQARTDAAARLGWLSPAAASLCTLARPITPDTWPQLRHDPGAVLLVARTALPAAVSRVREFAQDRTQ